MEKENTAIRLNRIMEERGLRQIDILNLAAPYCQKYNVKMNKSDISQYCSGKNEPGQEKLFILGAALGVSEAWLMGYDVPAEREVPQNQDTNKFSFLLESALNILSADGCTWLFSNGPNSDIIINDKTGHPIAMMSDDELVRRYQSSQKQGQISSESLLMNQEQQRLFNKVYGFDKLLLSLGWTYKIMFEADQENDRSIAYALFKSKGASFSVSMEDCDSFINDIENFCIERIQSLFGKYVEKMHVSNGPDSILPIHKPISRHIYAYMRKIACAGTGFYFDDIPSDTIEAPYMEGADFIIGVNGDSMEPDYHDGDNLYVKKTERLAIGDVGIFTSGNECYLKELGQDGLISRNPTYKNIPGTEDIRLIGKVIGKVSDD